MSCYQTSWVFFAVIFLFLGQELLTKGQSPCQERDLASVAPGRKCRKACTTDYDCRSTKKKCRCDDVCGLSCFNPNATCDGPPGLANGTVTGGNKYGQVAEYRCNDGFTLEGDSSRTCQSDRGWSGSSPTCRPIGYHRFATIV